MWRVVGLLLIAALVHCVGRQPAPVLAPAAPIEAAERKAPASVVAPAGPVADYEPLAGVVIHRDVEELAPELRPALERWLGPRLVWASWTAPNQDPEVENGTGLDPTLYWLRDYQPVAVRDEEGRLRLVHYLAENPNRSAFRPPAPEGGPVGTSWLPGPGQSGRWVPSTVVPLLHENGNLLVVGRHVLVSELLLESNAEPHFEPHLRAQGYRPRTRAEVIQVLAGALGREVDEVVVLPPMPFESTGHVDLFLLPLDDHTVMVPRLQERELLRVPEPERSIGRIVGGFLDDQARRLEELGLTVPRWPMMPPTLEVIDEDQETVDPATVPIDEIPAFFDLVVFSPANSLLLDVAPLESWSRARLAVLPAFERAFDDPVDRATAMKHQGSWSAALRRHRWEPLAVDASELVSYLGLFHCVSWPLPLE